MPKSLEEYEKRARVNEDLINQLTKRLDVLEKKGSQAVQQVEGDISKKAKEHIKAEVLYMKTEMKSLREENKKLHKKNDELEQLWKDSKTQIKGIKQGVETARESVEKIERENESFKNHKEYMLQKLQEFRAKVVLVQKENDRLKEQLVSQKGSGVSKQSFVQMTYNDVEEGEMYVITKDIVALKTAWKEAELGPLDESDFQSYLNREVKALELEEDDETVQVRFDNHDTQWMPASTLYKKCDGEVPVPKMQWTQMNYDGVEEGEMYVITKDISALKAAWKEAELGPLDESDFQSYLEREVKALEKEEDDETIQVRFDNHDTQWMPACTLWKQCSGDESTPVDSGTSGSVQMSFDTVEEGEMYTITGDFNALVAAWKEAELGPLDDSDFQSYLNREVKALELEEDDETVQVRFDNHDTQWVPASVLYGTTTGAAREKEESDSEEEAAVKAPSGPVWQTLETCEEGGFYELTNTLPDLREKWTEAELGPISDEDLQKYCGMKVKVVEIEEDDETAQCRLDNSDTQWFPICALAQEGSLPEPEKIYELLYFNIWGMASKIRLLLADLEIPYVNKVVGQITPELREEWTFGQVPILTTPDGEQICQSNAILRYLGNRFMCGGEDETLVDQVIEGINDWQNVYLKTVYDHKCSQEAKDHFLKCMTSPLGTPKINGTRVAQLAQFNKIFTNLFNPFVGGTKPSVADYYLFDLMYKLTRLYPERHDFIGQKENPALHGWWSQMKDRPNLIKYIYAAGTPKYFNGNKLGGTATGAN